MNPPAKNPIPPTASTPPKGPAAPPTTSAPGTSPAQPPFMLFDYMRDEAVRPAVLLAFRIAIYYLIFGLLWIAASDYALDVILKTIGDPWHIFNQTVKGFFFILLTAILLFFVVRHFIIALQRTQLEMQNRLESVAEQYRRLFHRSPSAMIIFEPTTRRILAANDVSLRLYGYSRDELLAMRTLDLVVEEERPRLLALVAYQEGAIQTVGPFQVRRRDGRIIFIEALTHQVDFNGKPARIAMVSDVTERLRTERSLALYRGQLEQRVAERTAELSRANARLRSEAHDRLRIEDELRAATAAAESANNAKSVFLAQTSHEIRTPLTSILGYADLLQSAGTSDQDRAKYLTIVRQNARHLSGLIDDLLDLSRAQMGNVKLVFGDHSPRHVAQEAVGLLHNRAAEAGLVLRADIHDGIPDSIHTDGVRLRQILLNLMENALKFTPEGSVVLSVYCPAQSPPSICFEVADTGIGIEEQHLNAIFEPFFQIEQGSTRRFSGSGLGLAVSRQLALLIGGNLLVSSNSGRGSTFTLSLPLPESAGPAVVSGESDPSAPSVHGHVLLAEDNDNIRLLVTEYLTRAGATVTEVVNGMEAVDHITASLGPNPTAAAYDLVLLDLHMPVLDGFAAMKQIRKLGFTGPVVGLTADFAENSSQQKPGEGWDAMCAKPINRFVFLPLLARLIHAKSHPSE